VGATDMSKKFMTALWSHFQEGEMRESWEVIFVAIQAKGKMTSPA